MAQQRDLPGDPRRLAAQNRQRADAIHSKHVALVDAGLVASAREYAVPPDHHANPFEALSRALRALALGYCTDVDDSAAWPTAKQAICPVGRESGATFLAHRETILAAQGRTLFPAETVKEQRARVKQIYNALNMDADVRKQLANHGADASVSIDQLDVPLPDGRVFRMDAYLRQLTEGTQWVAAEMEARLGMHTFIRAHQQVHAPAKVWKADRTLKAMVLSEAESFSRDAKVEWARQHGEPGRT